MIIARISNPYGPGQDFNKGVGFIDAALKKTLNHEQIEIWGDGSVVRDYIYIEDVCEMIGSLINYDGNEEVFNVSSNQGISLNDVISKMKEYGLALRWFWITIRLKVFTNVRFVLSKKV